MLLRAGAATALLDLLSILCLTILQVLIYIELKSFRLIRDWIVYTVIVLSFIFHTFAMIIWFAITEASFMDDCGDASTISEHAKVCSTDGPTLMIVGEILIPVAATYFHWIFKKRWATVIVDSPLPESTAIIK